jgi:arginase
VEAVTILHVTHASEVAAIRTAEGPRAIMDEGLVDALEGAGVPVEVERIDVERVAGPKGAVGEAFLIADRVARAVALGTSRGRLMVVLSGSCHAGLGAAAGVPGERRGVVWLDCHGDFNTPETTASGLVDGTTLAAITGRCWTTLCAGVAGFRPVRDEDVLLVGARDLDDEEARLLRESAVERIDAGAATTRGVEAIGALGGRADGVYLHVDLDILDPTVGRANAYATDGGLTVDELVTLAEATARRCPLRAVAFTSYDPAMDEDGAVRRAAVEVAGALVGALGT